MNHYDDHAWVEDAACRKHPDPDIWFAVGSDLDQHKLEEAVQVCSGCPVKLLCLQDAMSWEAGRQERYGVRGGLKASERAQLGLRFRRVTTDK